MDTETQASPERVGLPFAEIWMADFEFVVGSGERPRPVCMVAEEYWSGRQIRLWEHELAALDAAPFNTGPNAAFVAYFASAELGCFRALGWPLPTNTLDLFCEHRVLTNGTRLPHGNGLIGAARRYCIDTIGTVEKETMRELIMAGGPWSQAERAAILDYCASDVELLRPLLEAMSPDLLVAHQQLGHAVWRGRYMGAVATMEHNGVPMDTETLAVLNERWLDIQDVLIADVDKDYGVYEGRTFKTELFAHWLAENNVPWPRLGSGRLALDDGTFRSRARSYPQVSSLRELRHALGELRLNSLAVGPDGRNRTLLSPFRSKTSRNQPSNAKAIFGAATWIRGLIKPEAGTALAYLDFSSQEFAIAACLSGDERMWCAYESGDPYLQFAKDAGLAPPDGDKTSHGDVRDKCKAIVLGVQYGMSAYGMAHRAGILVAEARELLLLHHEHYRTFWGWADANVESVLAGGMLSTPMGWQFRQGYGTEANPRSILNWPMQSTGADILRLSCVRLMDAGVKICAPVHDAILIQASIGSLDAQVDVARQIMEQACRDLLGGRPCRVDADIIKSPNRYMDTKRGQRMWDTVMRAVGLPEYREETA
jgi:DNA polymerase-1